VSAGFDVPRLGIPVELVGLNLHVGRLNPDVSTQTAPTSFLLLIANSGRRIRFYTGHARVFDEDVLGVGWGVRALREDLLIRVRANLDRLWRGRR
jgi:hypothetical protein